MRRALALLVLAALAPLPVLGAAPASADAAGKQRKSAKVCKARAKRAKAERRRVTRRVRRARRCAGAKRVRWVAPRVTDGLRAAQPPVVVPPPSTTPPPPTGTTPPPTGSTPPPLGRLGVAATEFALRLSRTELAAGEALIELQNRGEDPHNLVILASSGGPAKATFPETGPGLLAKQRVKLTPGTYELLCTLPGHAQLGMQATLSVR